MSFLSVIDDSRAELLAGGRWWTPSVSYGARFDNNSIEQKNISDVKVNFNGAGGGTRSYGKGMGASPLFAASFESTLNQTNLLAIGAPLPV
ncbi:MAG: hypothetical protein RLZZ533_1710 [Cyanobacteriota bacterium]|jgi:hypothetical protein